MGTDDVQDYEPLLEGYEPKKAAIAGWLSTTRERLSDTYCQHVLQLAAHHHGPRAARALEAAVGLQPYNEEIVRALMVHRAQQGETRTVKKEFSNLARRLREDLRVEPELRTVELMDRILSRGHLGTSLPSIILLPPTIGAGARDPALLVLSGAFVEGVTPSLCRARTFTVYAPFTARKSDSLDVRSDYVVATRLRGSANPTFSISLLHSATAKVLTAAELPMSGEALPDAHWDFANGIATSIGLNIARDQIRAAQTTGNSSAYVEFLLAQKRLD
ncbi:MAG: bacterial transcriptional activator domain-containing protein, partial [Candidatus Devosia euplotis]|nr:bacterial transcriptional activator domain-containing protein [Candidatus Devosia euplotis]